MIKTLVIEPLKFQCTDGILEATGTLVLPNGEIEIPTEGGTFELEVPLTEKEIIDDTLFKLYALDRQKSSGRYFSVFGHPCQKELENGIKFVSEKLRYKVSIQGPAICFPLSLTYI